MSEREPNTIEGLVERYNALGFETMTTSFTTGPDESRAIGDLWQGEIDRVSAAFRFTSWTLSHCLDIRTSMLLRHNRDGVVVRKDGSMGGPVESNDYLRCLVIDDDAQILVSMLETRDVINHQVIQIARYPLRPESLIGLRALVQFDNEWRLWHPDRDEADRG